MTNRSISVTVSCTIKARRQVVFAAIAPIDLRTIFTGYGLLPSVVEVRNYPGHWDEVGLWRTPVFSDGGTARETLVTYRPPLYFSYQITNFTNIFDRIVSKAYGKWIFSEYSDGTTLVEWTYEFFPLGGRRLLVKFGIVPFWKRYMEKALRLVSLQVTNHSYDQQDGRSDE